MRTDRLQLAGRVAFVAACAYALWEILVDPDRGDVGIYREGARAAWGSGAVYDFAHNGHGFTYPPAAALGLGSLSWLPNTAMWSVLVVLGVLAAGVVLLLCVRRATRDVGAGARPVPLLLVAGLVACHPVVVTLQFGQVDLLLAAMVLVDLLVWRRGVLVGLATAFKLTPGLFVVYLLLRRRYAEAATAVAVFVASIVAGALVLPGPSRTYWLHNIANGTGVGKLTTMGNESIRGIVEFALGRPLGVVVWLVLAIPALVYGLWLAGRCAGAGLDLLAVGIVGCTSCVVSPIAWPHHWVWVLPVLCGLWTVGTRVVTRWVIAVVVLLIGYSLTLDPGPGFGYLLPAAALAWCVHTMLARLGTGDARGSHDPRRPVAGVGFEPT